MAVKAATKTTEKLVHIYIYWAKKTQKDKEHVGFGERLADCRKVSERSQASGGESIKHKNGCCARHTIPGQPWKSKSDCRKQRKYLCIVKYTQLYKYTHTYIHEHLWQKDIFGGAIATRDVRAHDGWKDAEVKMRCGELTWNVHVCVCWRKVGDQTQ